VVAALERKYGGSKRLLTAALNAIRQHPPVRTDNINGLERYIRDVQTLFDRLEEARLGEERLTQTTFKDLVRPLPFSYVTEFYKDLRNRGVEPSSDELFIWAKNKLEEMQDAYEMKGPMEPRVETQKDAKRSYNHHISTDREFEEEKERDPSGDEDEAEWCHIVAQDQIGNCCPLCSTPKERAEHCLVDCPHFIKLPWNAKRVIFWQFRLCYNCGNRKHIAANCSAPKCQKCGESHHVILHEPEQMPKSDKKKGTSLGVNGKEDKVSLLTLTVRVTNPETNDSKLVNCLLDSGSTLALMSTRLAEQLAFTGYKTPLALFGAGGKRADYYTVLGDVVVENPNGDDQERVTVRVIDSPAGDHIVPHIAQMRKDLDIADRATDGKIDLILGCAAPRLFLPLDTRKEAGGKRVFLKTPLGWGMMGELQSTQNNYESTSMFIQSIESDNKPFAVKKYRKIQSNLTPVDYTHTWCETETVVNAYPLEYTEHVCEKSIDPAPKHESGPTDIPKSNKSDLQIVNMGLLNQEVMELQHITELLENQWVIENQGEEKARSKEDIYAIRLMSEGRRRVKDRYEMPCLWRKGCPNLTNNLRYACARLRELDHRGYFTPEIRLQYDAVFQDWLNKGYVKRISDESLEDEKCWFWPHFPKIRGDKTTTKVRPVFDGKSECNGTSMNKQIMSGPNLLVRLNTCLLRFRRHYVTLGLDVQEMFLQIELDPASRRYHRFLWYDRPGHIAGYEMQRHIFGNPGSPGVSLYHVRCTAGELKESFPIAAESIEDSTLMDDLIDSFPSTKEAEDALQGSIAILKEAGMRAHKIFSNETSVLRDVKTTDRATTMELDWTEFITAELTPSTKILGLVYLATEDIFSFQFAPNDIPNWTKRDIAKTYPTIFDPLGFISPHILEARKILQACFACKLGWDEPLPMVLTKKWRRWLNDSRDLTQIRIPRHSGIIQDIAHEAFYFFGDASERGYSANCYRVTWPKDKEVGHATLLIAKAKVAPLKTLSIPRLELMACELILELAEEVGRVHKLDSNNVSCYTDSKDVLFWLNTETLRLSRFVAHRVCKIEEKLPKEIWRHVPSGQNPADIGSRGMKAAHLAGASLWWKGPSFITETKEHKKEDTITNDTGHKLSPEGEKEVIKCKNTNRCLTHARCDRVALSFIKAGDRLSCSNYSSMKRYMRTIITIKRAWSVWIVKTYNSNRRKTVWSQAMNAAVNKAKGEKGLLDEITSNEWAVAERDFLRASQSEFCEKELSSLRCRGIVPRSSPLNGYSPFLDDHGLMRVGGRLQNAKFLSLAQRSPLIVPKGHAVTMIMQYLHDKEQKHALGPNALHAKFCDQYFALGASSVAKKTCYQCVVCRKIRARNIQPRMGELPLERIGQPEKRSEVFQTVQIDIMGPFYVSIEHAKTKQKRWALLIVCMLYKAIHIEMVSGLSTEAIGNALERFTSRRGCVTAYYSDNQPAFKALAKAYQKGSIHKQIEWHFAPPSTPHQVGLVEAGVKSAKQALNAVMSHRLHSEDDLATALIVIEGLLNSRPIASLPTSSSDIAVTAADFLGANGLRRVTSIGPRSRLISELSIAKRWIRLNKMLDTWWKLYYAKHLTELHKRNKWTRQSRQLKPGDVVLLRETVPARGDWPMGIVVRAVMGRDGVVRAVHIRKKGQTVERHPSRVVYLTDGLIHQS